MFESKERREQMYKQIRKREKRTEIMKQRREKFRGEMVNKILLLFLEYCYNTILTLELYCSSIAKKFAIVVFTIF